MSYIDHKSYVYQCELPQLLTPENQGFYGGYLECRTADEAKETPFNYYDIDFTNYNRNDAIRVVIKFYGTLDVGEMEGEGIVDDNGLLLFRRDFYVPPLQTLHYREYPTVPFRKVRVYREWYLHTISGSVDQNQYPLRMTLTRLNTGDARNIADHYGKPVDEIYTYGTRKTHIKTVIGCVPYEGRVDTEVT